MKKILVVDDEQFIISLLKKVFQAFNCEVYFALSGKEALDIYESQGSDIELIITDMYMPHMTGQELVSKLTEKRKDLKVITMSGSLDDNIEFNHKVAHFYKPFNIKELMAMVDGILA